VHVPTSLELAEMLYGGWSLSPPARRPGRGALHQEGSRRSPDPDEMRSLEQNQRPDEVSRAQSVAVAEPAEAADDLAGQQTSSTIYSVRSVIRCRGDSTGDMGLDSDFEEEVEFVDRGVATSWAQGVIVGGILDYAREIGEDAGVEAALAASSSSSPQARERPVPVYRQLVQGLREDTAVSSQQEELAPSTETSPQMTARRGAPGAAEETRVSPPSPQPVPPPRPSRRDQSPQPPQAMAPRSRGAPSPSPRSAGGRGNNGLGGGGRPAGLMPTLDDLLLHGGMRVIPPVPVGAAGAPYAKAPMRSARYLPQRRLPRLEVSERRALPLTAR